MLSGKYDSHDIPISTLNNAVTRRQRKHIGDVHQLKGKYNINNIKISKRIAHQELL